MSGATTSSAATPADGVVDMKVDPVRAAALAASLGAVAERVAAAAAAAGGRPVRLVAVSKLKPVNDILALHQPNGTSGSGGSALGQVHFGENYAQELRDKAALLPRSIRWHFIGGLQSGHCKNLARIPNLWCVSSVDSVRKAKLLDAARGSLQTETKSPLHIHVQVNTSGEESKSGCAPGADTVALCRTIADECPNLRLLGLMTIGAIARSKAVAADSEEANPDFVALREQRDLVAAALGMADAQALELSMGMSDDFASAIASGSGEVRVGSTIFGIRPPKGDAKLVV